jgi:putative Mg2+ transporter-C (MgtC) family protein
MPWHLVLSAIPNLVAALALGSLVGAERQWRHRTAGLKTNALVSVGAASFVTLAAAGGSADATARIAAQIVSGIGFLGAGVILREGLNVRGLNTAATVWSSAAVGSLAGAGELALAALTAIAILTVNLGLQPLVNVLNRLPGYAFNVETSYTIVVHCHPAGQEAVRAVLLAPSGGHGITVDQLTTTRVTRPPAIELSLKLHLPTRDDAWVDRLLGTISAREDVLSAKWVVGGMTE